MMLLGALVGICGLWGSAEAGRQVKNVEGRDGVNLLDPWERMEPSTRGRRSRYFENFERWASLRVEETLWEIGARRIDRLLAESGQQHFGFTSERLLMAQHLSPWPMVRLLCLIASTLSPSHNPSLSVVAGAVAGAAFFTATGAGPGAGLGAAEAAFA